jgi:hypothetical protein
MRPKNRREPANVGVDDPLLAMSGGGPSSLSDLTGSTRRNALELLS